MKLTNFEQQVLLKYRADEDFIIFLKENSELKLEFPTEDLRKEEKVEDNNYVVESVTTEYLEEISHIPQLSKEEIDNLLESLDDDESSNTLIEGNLREVANIAFDYLVAGIDYLDLIQEGNIGAIKALDSYRPSNGDILNYMKLWARKEMLIFVDEKVQTEKYMYKGYFLKRQEELIEHEIVAELEEEESVEELSPEEKSEIIGEKIASLEDIDLKSIPKKMSYTEEEIIKKFYGLVGDRRESLFEIEDSLDLKRGEGEKLFETAITKLSLGGGRSLKI